ncbi:MAG: hypothetical protein LBU65_00005, partial [Planctomycetaceae bacterium]|nr:hypothetical protein [Planctomycetaceae bacterium]
VDTKTQCITYDYDTANGNRLPSVIYPSGKTLTYTYDNFDNVSSINENKTPLVSYMYDGSGSPIQTTYNRQTCR